MGSDIEVLQVVRSTEIKRKSLPMPELREKRSIAFHDDKYDPTTVQDPPSLHSRQSATSDSVSSSPILSSVSSIPIEKFVIPTRTDSLASSFPFHQRLYDYGVTHDEWYLFTSALVEVASLTLQEDWAAWTAGISTGVLTTSLLIFAGPVAGYYTGRSVHRKKVVSKVKDGLMEEGKLRAVLHEWNEKSFQDKGFRAWIELPALKGEIDSDEIDKETRKKRTRKEKKAKEKERSRFRIVIVPHSLAMGTYISQSSWNLAEVQSGQWSRISEAPNTERQHPLIAELPA